MPRDKTQDDYFPDIVLRGAARLSPKLKDYFGQLPRTTHHYGGWHSMTYENLPLIVSMGPEGAFTDCAQSGFRTLVACANCEFCAAWVTRAKLPSYSHVFFHWLVKMMQWLYEHSANAREWSYDASRILDIAMTKTNERYNSAS